MMMEQKDLELCYKSLFLSAIWMIIDGEKWSFFLIYLTSDQLRNSHHVSTM